MDRRASFFPLLPAVTAVLALFASQKANAWQPGTGNPAAADGLAVNAADRRDVLAFYQCIYEASSGYASRINWTGSVTGCSAGTTAASFKEDVRRRINFFRALTGLPGDIVFDAAKSAKCQEAALLFAANGQLSHFPASSWTCYTANAYEAAGSSNIALGTFGPGSVDAFIEDDGSNNTAVGHRRWLLYSRAKQMGTGDVPPAGTSYAANAIWVIGNNKPAPAPSFVAWPNEGYVPHSLVPGRWSLSYPGADFSQAAVTMSQGAVNVPLTVLRGTGGNMGDNTLVWEPSGIPASVTEDRPYTVTVTGIAGGPAAKTYTVRLFNPEILGESVSIAGSAAPPTTGQTYTFNSIAQADSYELEVASSSTAPWTEGAEDSPAPRIVESISPGYSLRQTGLVRTGARAFQLTFPSGVFSDQSFLISRAIMPTAASELRFHDRGRFATATTTLQAQVSSDGGSTWTTVSSRPGAGLSSQNWDASWIGRSASLAAYAGQIIQVRFIMKANGGSVVQGTGTDKGFFIDDVTVTGAAELAGRTVTTLAGTATSFSLNAATAGGALVAGNAYSLRIRPSVGCHWFGFGPQRMVTPQVPTGYDAWVAARYPAVTGGFTADHEKDGIANGVEYAFNLNPTTPNSAASLPLPAADGSGLLLSYTEPPGITGISYAAECSSDLISWHPVTDTGSAAFHRFHVPAGNPGCLFIRHKISRIP